MMSGSKGRMRLMGSILVDSLEDLFEENKSCQEVEEMRANNQARSIG